jgi:KUP system potassium uptake protein
VFRHCLIHCQSGPLDYENLTQTGSETPDVPAALRLHREAVGFAPEEASYFLGNEVPVPSLQPELPRWQEQIFAFLTRNAVRAPDYFLIPPPRVVELGTRVEL